MSEKNRYLDIIKNQRSTKTKKKFSGTLLDYLQLVEKDPTVTDHAHKRLYDAIVERGSATMDKSDARRRKLFNDENVKIYDYFQEEFFGMESVISKVMRFLRSAMK